MSTVLENKPAARGGAADKLAFFKMFATAVEEGMRTLKQGGIEKVLIGVTDIHRVRSVCIK